MAGSRLAEEIVREYKKEQFFKKKSKQKCKNKSCTGCQFQPICTSCKE